MTPLVYIQTDIPEGMTIREWRRSRPPLANRRRWWLFLFAGWKA